MKVYIQARRFSSGELKIACDGAPLFGSKQRGPDRSFSIYNLNNGIVLATGQWDPSVTSSAIQAQRVLCRLTINNNELGEDLVMVDMVKSGSNLEIVELGKVVASGRLGDRKCKFPEIGIESSAFRWTGGLLAFVKIHEANKNFYQARAVSILVYLFYSNSWT